MRLQTMAMTMDMALDQVPIVMPYQSGGNSAGIVEAVMNGSGEGCVKIALGGNSVCLMATLTGERSRVRTLIVL